MDNFDLRKYLAEGKIYEASLYGAKSEQFGKEMIANLVSDGNKVELVDSFNNLSDEFKKRPDADILAMYGGNRLKQPNKKYIQPEITIAVKGDKEAEEIIKEYPKTYIPESRYEDKRTKDGKEIIQLFFAPDDEIKKGQIDPLAEGKLNEQMYIDDEEFEMEMGRSKKDSLKKEMIFHVDQLMDGNIDMNDFINVVEDIMSELK